MFCLRVALVMMSLHSCRTMTKTWVKRHNQCKKFISNISEGREKGGGRREQREKDGLSLPVSWTQKKFLVDIMRGGGLFTTR